MNCLGQKMDVIAVVPAIMLIFAENYLFIKLSGNILSSQSAAKAAVYADKYCFSPLPVVIENAEPGFELEIIFRHARLNYSMYLVYQIPITY